MPGPLSRVDVLSHPSIKFDGPQPVTQSGSWSFSLTGAAAVTQSGTWTVALAANSNVTVNGTVTANIGTTNGLALDTTVGGLFKAGQTIGNTAFGISGTLPAYASPPTFNLGTVASPVPVTATALPLPAGASTSALQTAGNATLTAISGQLPATLGAKASSASVAVVIATDQAPVAVTDAGGSFTVDTGTPGVFALTPSGNAGNAIIPTRNTNSASLVLKTAPGNMYSAYSVAGSAGYVLIALDRNTVPTSGSALTLTEVISMAQVPANGAGVISPPDIPDRFVNGCVLIATTSLTTFTPPNPLPVFNRGKVA